MGVGRAAEQQAGYYEPKTDAGCRVAGLLGSDSRPALVRVCVRTGVVMETHQIAIVDDVCDVGQWSSPPAPAHWTF